MGRDIYDIINDMADVLNASQIQKLKEVLVKRYAIIGVMLKKCSKQ